jgi:hypothetical protein
LNAGGLRLAQLFSALTSPTQELPTALGNVYSQAQLSQTSNLSRSRPVPFASSLGQSPSTGLSDDDDDDDVGSQTPTKVTQRRGAATSRKRASPSTSTGDDQMAGSPAKRARFVGSHATSKVAQQPVKSTESKRQGRAKASKSSEAPSNDAVTEVMNARDKRLVEEARRVTGCDDLNYVRTRKVKVRSD